MGEAAADTQRVDVRQVALVVDLVAQSCRRYGGVRAVAVVVPSGWDRRAGRHRTAMAPDDPRTVIARQATVCELYIGRAGKTRQTAVSRIGRSSRARMR
jgi:hypothetical protein